MFICSDSEYNWDTKEFLPRSESERLFGIAADSELRVNGFGELSFETIDDTMMHVFGASASELIYRIVERGFSLKREELGEIEAFYATWGFKRQVKSLLFACLIRILNMNGYP